MVSFHTDAQRVTHRDGSSASLPQNRITQQIKSNSLTKVNELLGKVNSRQRSTLPAGLPTSTIDAERLNCCVRDGNRWVPLAIVTEKLYSLVWCPCTLKTA